MDWYRVGPRCRAGREGAPVLSVVNADGTTTDGSFLIDEIVREGARRMLAAALEAEVNSYIAELADQRDEKGHRLVVRNGHHQPRKVTTAAGVVEVKAPRVNDKRVDEATGERKRFSSAILPPWCRKSPKISEVLPLLYLHGLSSGDFVPALEQFLGSSAGLSSATITRLTPNSDRPTTQRSWTVTSRRSTTYTYGPMASTSTSAWRRPKPASWYSSGSALTGPRNWSRSRTATASQASPGPT
jgi:hypothetical protein